MKDYKVRLPRIGVKDQVQLPYAGVKGQAQQAPFQRVVEIFFGSGNVVSSAVFFNISNPIAVVKDRVRLPSVAVTGLSCPVLE